MTRGAPLSAGVVRDQAITLLFAGHDTTTTTFTFLAHELGRNPRAREAVEAELDRVLGRRNPTAAELDGQALPVLERSLKETLRRYPPAWVGPRRTTRDVTLGGVQIPAEMGVHYSSWATHHLPHLYPDPFRFDPDRFLPGREATLPARRLRTLRRGVAHVPRQALWRVRAARARGGPVQPRAAGAAVSPGSQDRDHPHARSQGRPALRGPDSVTEQTRGRCRARAHFFGRSGAGTFHLSL